MKHVAVRDTHSHFSPLRWYRRVSQLWYGYTSPPGPSQEARLLERTKARRGRLTSTIVAGLIVISLSIVPLWGVIGDPSLVLDTVLSLLCYGIALPLNKRGNITLAGTIILVGFNLLIVPSLLFPSGGLQLADAPNFDLLAISDLIAVSMLPARSVWLMALVNCVFISVVVFVVPHGGDLGQAIAVAGAGIASRPICLQVVCAVVVFLLVRNQEQAIVRADRSEEIAKLQAQLLLQKQEVEQQQRVLEASIRPIIETHLKVAKGDYSARVPLTQQNALWQIAGSLNNLLARVQSMRQQAAYVRQMQEQHLLIRTEVARFLALFHSARIMAQQQPFIVESTPGGTIIDKISHELRTVAFQSRTKRAVFPMW